MKGRDTFPRLPVLSRTDNRREKVESAYRESGPRHSGRRLYEVLVRYETRPSCISGPESFVSKE